MIAENIESVAATLTRMSGHVHAEVAEVLRQAAAVLGAAAEDARNLEAAPLAVICEPRTATLQ